MQHTPLEKLDKKHFAKGPRGLEKTGLASFPQDENAKEIALMETKMRKMCDLLEEVSGCCLISFGVSYIQHFGHIHPLHV